MTVDDLPGGATPPPYERGSTRTGEDARLAPVMEAVAARLRGICEAWEAAEFAAVVERIARTKLRWADRGHGD